MQAAIHKTIIDESIARAKSENIDRQIRHLSSTEFRKPTSQKQKDERRKRLKEEIGDPEIADSRLERILKGDDLTDIYYLSLGVLRSRAVCRIVIRCNGVEEGYGTGFLVAPGVIMTNHHVLSTIDQVRESYAEFNYERDCRGNISPAKFPLSLAQEPLLCEELDMTLAAVEQRSTDGRSLDQFGWMRLNPEPGKAFIGEYLTAIQHPRGGAKQVCVRENKLLKYADAQPFVWYQTDTDSGSSGSPVFNNSWDVVALHHSSVPRTNKKGEWLTRDGRVWKKGEMSEDSIAWIANEGVRISRIVGYLKVLKENELAQKVVTAPEFPLVDLSVGPVTSAKELQVGSGGEGNGRSSLPIEINIRIGSQGNVVTTSVQENKPETVNRVPPQIPPPASASSVSQDSLDVTEAGEFESVSINQKTYPARNGYDPKFLGEGFIVPLPVVTKIAAKNFGEVARLKDGSDELKYWNYSVKINQRRRMAYFSALNMVKSDETGRKDKKWIKDPRMDERFQLGDEFYEDQPDHFEEFRRFSNPYDKGHLTSYNDMQWVTDDQLRERHYTITPENRKRVLKEHGDDTFHYSNCAPQHWKFNENELWRRLEVAAITQLSQDAANPKLCLINGPVFDAPSPLRTPDNKVSDLRVRDGSMRIKGSNGQAAVDIQVPKMFYKVIAYLGKSRRDPAKMELRTKAFVVTQENLLGHETDHYHADANTYKLEDFSAQEIKLYQVSMTDLQKLTGLDFGPLCASDQYGHAEEAYTPDSASPIEIDDLNQVVF